MCSKLAFWLIVNISRCGDHLQNDLDIFLFPKSKKSMTFRLLIKKIAHKKGETVCNLLHS